MSKKLESGSDIGSLLDKNPHSVFWFFNVLDEKLHVVCSFSVDYSKLIHDLVISLSPHALAVVGFEKDGFYQFAYAVNSVVENKILLFCDSDDDTYITEQEYDFFDFMIFYNLALLSDEFLGV